MLIDWITANVCCSDLDVCTFDKLKSMTGTIISINPDGTVEYETFRRESIKSDSHKITCSLGGFFQITGSPARLHPDKLDLYDNVFGSTDIKYNFYLMHSFIEEQIGIVLPPIQKWNLTRLDITQNYFLGNLGQVEKVLNHHRKAEAGRYQTATFADSVYISKGNQVVSGKMYSKGKQLKKDFLKRFPVVMRAIRDDYSFDAVALELAISIAKEHEFKLIKELCLEHDASKELSDSIIKSGGFVRYEAQYNYELDSNKLDKKIEVCIKEIKEKITMLTLIYEQAKELSERLIASSGLIRYEAQYNSRYFKQDLKKIGKGYKMSKSNWYDLNDKDLENMHKDFWHSRVGRGIDTVDTKEIIIKFENAAVELGFKKGVGFSAFSTWNLIQTTGHLNVYSPNNPNSAMKRRAFLRHKQIALKAGLTQADFQSGEVIPFSSSVINLVSVNSWSELKRLAV